MYEYLARLVKVVDGDTFDLDIDLGMHVHRIERVRLYGVNAPEHNTDAGKAAIEWVRAWFAAQQGPLLVDTYKDKTEKYGRLLAVVQGDEQVLASVMIAAGHAVAWDGHGPRPVAA